MMFTHRKYCDLVYSAGFPPKEMNKTCPTTFHIFFLIYFYVHLIFPNEKVIGHVLICLWSVYFQQITDNSAGITLQKRGITNLKYKLRGKRTIFLPKNIANGFKERFN